MRRSLVAACCVLAWFVLPAAASAQTARISQQVFDPQGDPLLTANPSPDGAKGEVTWPICSPGSGPCRLAAPGPVLTPGEQPAGTTFLASVEFEGQASSDTSDPWLGRVTATAPPRLEGKPVVGKTVTPSAATWTGGWGGEYEDLRVQACRTATAQRCKSLTAPLFFEQAADPSATIPARYAGWYLFAADQRLPADSVFAAPATPA